jgi:hypothetical protein
VRGSGHLISAPLSTASGKAECSVVNTHPTKNAILNVFVYDESCLRLSYALNIPPGGHDSAEIHMPPTRWICVVSLTSPANQVARNRLVASFSALDSSGQPTATLPIVHFQGSFSECVP